MSRFEITSLQNSSVWNLYRMRNRIETDPDYQRQSDVWTPDKRRLLVDTILNGLDVPKIYLHKFVIPKLVEGTSYDYAIIDGKQRLQTVWDFIDGKLALDDNFEYFKDQSVVTSNMTYSELGKKYPELKSDFDSFPLSVICIETEDIEMIEELFSRLNEAVPLSAAEKRNAFGGPIPEAIRRVAGDSFFKERLPFGNSRYRHFDIAAKFLYIEESARVVDMKKAYLDRFVKQHADSQRDIMPGFLQKCSNILELMNNVFVDKDYLIRSVGMIILYYHIFRLAQQDNWLTEITRSSLCDFENKRSGNREIAKIDLSQADYDLIEFDKYSQSPNDGYALRIRLRIILNKTFNKVYSIENL